MQGISVERRLEPPTSPPLAPIGCGAAASAQILGILLGLLPPAAAAEASLVAAARPQHLDFVCSDRSLQNNKLRLQVVKEIYQICYFFI